jgi:Methyltransferase domain
MREACQCSDSLWQRRPDFGNMFVNYVRVVHHWTVNRIKAVQQALRGRSEPVYLEIGVSRGSAFRRITADTKIAVDPAFKISAPNYRRAETTARETRYFELTSDAFFATQSELLERHGVDVALIDGLHTYEQALQDVDNVLPYLREDGIIVMHDCNPTNRMVAFPANSYEEFRAQNRLWDLLWATLPAWSGDVWKAIVHLRSTRDDLQVAVLKCDFGVGLIRKGKPESTLSYSPAQVDALSYADLATDRQRLLNLKPAAHLAKFMGHESVSGRSR